MSPEVPGGETLTDRIWAQWRRQAELRFDSYLSGPSELKVNGIARYRWNVELCEALYPVLHLFEVSFRNAIDWSLRKRVSEDWLTDEALFLINEKDKIRAAIRALEDRGRRPTHARIVAELTLGFWTGLFSEPYEHSFVRPVLAQGLKQVPPEHKNRSALAGRLKRIRDIRNRAFHFEPIWNRADLHGDYLLIRTTCEWISPLHCRLLLDSCRFIDVYKRGWTPIAKEILYEIHGEGSLSAKV